MTNTNQNYTAEDIEKEAKINAFLDDTKIKMDTFDWQTQKRARIISRLIEEASHHLNVTEHEIGKSMANCLKKIYDAGNSVMLPE